jgi:hypothetical protein
MAITKLIADSITSGAIANTPYFRASMSSNQSISNETHTLVNFNTTEFESSSSLYDTTNKRFTVPSGQAGKYQISAGVRDAGGSSQANRFMVTIYVNGALADTSLRNVAVTRNTGSSLVSGLINLSVGDYIEVRAFQDTSFTQTLYGGTSLIQSYTFFTGYKIIE